MKLWHCHTRFWAVVALTTVMAEEASLWPAGDIDIDELSVFLVVAWRLT